MSRWTRRSKEEKERIAREQKELREFQPRTITTAITGGVDDKKQMELLKEHEMPMRCAVHGWVAPPMYILTMEVPPVIGNEPVMCLSGKCTECGNGVKRYIIPSIMGLDAMMIVPLIMDELRRKGRLEDKR